MDLIIVGGDMASSQSLVSFILFKYREVFSLRKHTSIRLNLALTTILDLELEQLDVKIAFLYG